MNATFDYVVPDGTPSDVSCPWRLVPGRPPEDTHQTLWWSRLTGLAAEDAAEHWIECVHPDDRDVVHNAWTRAVEHGDPYLAVYRVFVAGGDTHLLLAYGLPVNDGPDGALAWSGQLIDISLYQRSTNYAASVSHLITLLSEARTSEEIPEIVRSVVQDACQSDAVALVLPASDCESLAVAASSGFPDDSLPALLDLPGYEANLRDRLPSHYSSADRGDRSTCQIRDDALGFQTVMIAQVPGPDGRAGVLVAAYREVQAISPVDCEFIEAVALHTAQTLNMKNAFHAELRAQTASESAHRHLELVANAVPALIVYLDNALRIQFCNSAFVEWLGLVAPPSPDTPLGEVIDRSLFERIAPMLQGALAGHAESVQITLGAGDQRIRAVELTIEPSFAAQGDIRGLAILGFDVSQRERAIEREKQFTEISAALSQVASYDEVVSVIVRHAADVFGATSVAIVLAAAGQALVWTGPWEDGAWHLDHAALPPNAPTWQVMEQRRPLVIRVPTNNEIASPVLDLMPGPKAPGFRILLPLIVSFEPTGVLALSLPTEDEPDLAEMSHLQLTAGICAGALDRARLHDALREREARFRHLAEALPQIVWVSSGDGSRLEYLNRRWEEFTGISLADVPDSDISLLTHPDDRDQERQRWQRSLRSGQVFEIEIRVRRSDGAYIWFLNRGVPIRGPGGEVETWFGTMTDIDTHRTTMTHQSVISTLDTQIRLLSDPAQILQTLVTTIGRHLQVDRCFLTEVLDIEYGESTESAPAPAIAVRALWVAGDREDIDSIREMAPILSRQFANELRPGMVISLNDLEEDAPSDQVREIAARLGVRAIIIVPYLRAGRWVAGITVHSLTPRKWTAAELAIVESGVKRTWPLVERSRAVEALAESENRLRNAAEAANFSSFDFDPRSGSGFWSADTHRVFRRRETDEPPGSLDELAAMVHPDDRQRLRDLIAGASDPDASDVVIGEFRHQTDDGETCWFLLRGSVHLSGLGNDRIVERIRGVLMDITARKREEEERLVALDAAAHDLKNPVATIRALAQVGMRLESTNDQPDDQMTELLKSIEGATGRLTDIIGDFLDTAHLRAGRELPLQRHMIDLGVVLAERVDEWREAHPDRQFIHSSSGVAIRGCWDESRLRRVFDNLIGNAIKFSPEGGPVKVNMTRKESGGVSHVLVTITDYGIGIAASDLARVQQTFERGSNVPDSIPGTGMGLIAARLITEQHGGTLSLDSQESRGTTVVVRLPIEDCQ